MAYSGIVKDADLGIKPAGRYPRRVIMFTALAAVIGWAFTTYMPQIPEFSLRVGLGFGMIIALVAMTATVSDERGQRMFAGVLLGAAFVVGMWGLWLDAEFGAIPTVEQVRSAAQGQSYALEVFGKPVALRSYIFEIWVAMTLVFAAAPVLAGLAKPPAKGTRPNPYSVHADFAQSFFSKLIVLPAIGFSIAAGAVYAYPHLGANDIPIEIAVLPPLLAGFIYKNLHMSFARALVLSTFGGLVAAAGFWVPWLYMTYGQDGMIGVLSDTPQAVLAWAQSIAGEYAYTSDTFGTVTDYGPWTFEIWAGLTLTYFAAPIIVTLCRRFFYLLRAV